MTLLQFRPVVTPQEVEGKLRGLRPYLKESGWSEEVLREGLRLDLSRVQYADFGAMAQILLLVEGALRHEAEVGVALPLGRPRRGERNWVESREGRGERLRADAAIRAAVRHRQGALRFMHNSGFVGCLHASHVPNVDSLCQVDFDYDPLQDTGEDAPGSKQGEEAEGELGAEPQTRYGGAPTNILPLEWLPTSADEDREAWENKAIRLLRLRGVSLSASEAEAVATVVFRELLDNVRDHASEEEQCVSCPPAALVGGVVLRRFFSGAAAVGGRRSTADYGNWVAASGAAVLRMVVGDSGEGICRTLPPDPKFKPSKRAREDRAWSENETRLFYSMAPWSSRHGKAETRSRYVRGLASVRRAVGEAHGALLLRSGDALSGYVYPPRLREAVGEAPLAWCPGTLVDITLAPGAVPQPREGVEERRESVSALGVATLPPPQRQTELRQSFASNTSTGEHQIAVVAGELAIDVNSHYDAYLTLLQVADDLADRAGLVVITPAQSRTELAPRLRAFDDVRRKQGGRAESPILVIDERGLPEWLGVTSEQAAVLDMITRGPTMRVSREEILNQLGCPSSQLDRQLEPLRRWIAFDREEVWVAVTPQAVADACSAALADRIGMAEEAVVDRAARGEVLITPTLASVDRWLSIERLIDSVGGGRLVGHLLGLRVAAAIRESEPDLDLSVVSVGNVPKDLVAAFKTAAGAGGRDIALVGESGTHDDPGAPFVYAETDFVCLSDGLVTGNHVRHAIHDLVRAGARPRAVACVLDARDDRTELYALGHPLPVSSLVALPLIVERPAATERPIELFSPPAGFQHPPPPPSPPVATETLLDWCERSPESLLTGHIARFGRRHFATFLDIKGLLAGPARDEIAHQAVGQIEDWQASEADGGGGSEPGIRELAFVHPGGPTDGVGALARLVRDAWSARPNSLPAQVPLGLPRTVSAGRNVLLAPDAAFAPGTGVVIVDWGAVTLHTLHDMLRIVADRGAASILALVLTSQLNDDEEAGVTGLESIRGSVPGQPGSQGTLIGEQPAPAESGTPTRVRILSSFRMGFSPVSECALCQHGHDYQRLAETAPTQLLRDHARAMARALEPRDLTAAREDGSFDSLGFHLDHADAVAVVGVRQAFERARSSTRERMRLRQRLETADSAELDSIIRTLALEPRWLKLPPLRFKSTREALVDSLRRRMHDEGFTTAAAPLRRQYYLVLRAVAKDAYLEDLPQLLGSAVRDLEDPAPADELVFGAFTLGRRVYHRGERDVSMLERGLERAREELSREAPGQPRLAVVGGTLSALLADSEYRRAVALSRQTTPQEAWRDLRNNFFTPVVSHVVEMPIEVVRGSIRVEKVRSVERWERTMSNWQKMRTLLVQKALPALTVVEEIIVEALSAGALIDEIPRARRACGEEAMQDLARLDDLFTSFVADPTLALINHEELERQWSWWYHFFFRAKEGLLKLCEECPCDAEALVRDVLSEYEEDPEALERPLGTVTMEQAIGTGGSSLEVFCHADVLRRAIHHLIANATQEKHARDYGQSDPVNLRLEIEEDGWWFRMRMLNDGTDASRETRSGRGLDVNRAAIESYGGKLSSEPADEPWTYQATVALPLWGREPEA